MTTRRLFAATAAFFSLIAVAPAAAQITTTIAKPKPNEQVQAAAARREAATQDSVARVTLTDMKTWVDSAANALAVRPDTAGTPSVSGVAAPQPPAAGDSAQPSSPASPQEPAPREPEFREGARAPNTATSFPTLALVGGALIIVGTVLRRRATASVRARR
jgi:hypothetical protein